jgi:molybdate transport system substrate-binding protein
MRAVGALVLLALLVVGAPSVVACKKDPPAGAPELKVAAASDLAFAFKDLGAAYTKKTGQQVTFSFGSTGLLAKQIAEGAPFDVFAAANVSFADDAVKSGACAADSKTLYATGRIAMWSKAGTEPPKSIADLADAKWAKIAIANPDHAPYGRAAKDAMTKAGVWDKVQPRVVYGENVQQTLQFAQSGNAEVAVVALSLATVTEGGTYSTVPAEAHDRIDQTLVACKGRGTAVSGDARRFVAFVGSEEARAVMRRYGFLLPGEASAASAK